MLPLIILSFLLFISSSSSQNIFSVAGLNPPPAPLGASVPLGVPSAPGVVPHHAVLQASADEARLPPHLTNPHYKNARIREALARHSWLGPGEQPVYEREAEKIDRREIYTVLNHAGFVRTNRV